MEFVICNFCHHGEPLIDTPDLMKIIEETPSIFGDLWELQCEVKNIHVNWNRGKHLIKGKKKEAFFKILTLARMSNRQLLVHWALVQNLSNFSRGVPANAEAAFAFFGSSVCTRT